MKLKVNVGQALRALREAKGLSQVDVARRAGMRQGQLATIESSGERASNIQLSTAVRVAAALDVDLNWFLR